MGIRCPARNWSSDRIGAPYPVKGPVADKLWFATQTRCTSGFLPKLFIARAVLGYRTDHDTGAQYADVVLAVRFLIMTDDWDLVGGCDIGLQLRTTPPRGLFPGWRSRKIRYLQGSLRAARSRCAWQRAPRMLPSQILATHPSPLFSEHRLWRFFDARASSAGRCRAGALQRRSGYGFATPSGRI